MFSQGCFFIFLCLQMNREALDKHTKHLFYNKKEQNYAVCFSSNKLRSTTKGCLDQSRISKSLVCALLGLKWARVLVGVRGSVYCCQVKRIPDAWQMFLRKKEKKPLAPMCRFHLIHTKALMSLNCISALGAGTHPQPFILLQLISG